MRLRSKRNVTVPVVIPASRRLYWSVRRELWENRSIYLAPLAVAALFLLGFLISAIHPPAQMRDAMALDPMRHQELVEQPYTFAAFFLMGITFIVAVFYCLDALYGERRDRSILFWKSLPVSDLTTVLAKASIPLLHSAPAHLRDHRCHAIDHAAAEQRSHAGSRPKCRDAMEPFAVVPDVADAAVPPGGHSWALVCAGLLLDAAGLRLGAARAILWAVLPPLAIGVAEKIAFNTSHFAALLGYLFGGGPEDVPFTAGKMAMAPLTAPAPG